MPSSSGAWANFGSNAYFNGAWNLINPNLAGVNLHMNADAVGTEFRFARMEPNLANLRAIAVIGTQTSYIKEGNFGIGTTNPALNLHVRALSGNAGVKIDSAGAGNYPHVRLANAGDLKWDFGSDIANADNFYVFSWKRTAGADRVFSITKDGNVGIGTTNPQSELHVAGDGRIDGSIFSGFMNVSGTGDIVPGYSNVTATGSSRALWLQSAPGGATMWLGRDGNAGIGTTTPKSALQVAGYVELDLTTTGAGNPPPSVDCSIADHHGRMKVDASGNGKLWICATNGWVAH